MVTLKYESDTRKIIYEIPEFGVSHYEMVKHFLDFLHSVGYEFDKGEYLE